MIINMYIGEMVTYNSYRKALAFYIVLPSSKIVQVQEEYGRKIQRT